MIPVAELQHLADARLEDAVALAAAGRFDGAVYVCGYAVEIGLKVRICKAMNWADFPETNGEFKQYQSLRTHSLDVLLRFSSVETLVKSWFGAEWAVLTTWSPDMRYRYTDHATSSSARQMVDAARAVLSSL